MMCSHSFQTKDFFLDDCFIALHSFVQAYVTSRHIMLTLKRFLDCFLWFFFCPMMKHAENEYCKEHHVDFLLFD